MRPCEVAQRCLPWQGGPGAVVSKLLRLCNRLKLANGDGELHYSNVGLIKVCFQLRLCLNVFV